MENVKGLTSKKFENEFKEMQEELEKAGYNNYWQILNARDFGIPQNRERIFMISIRKDIDKGFDFPEPMPNQKSLSDKLETDLDILKNHIHTEKAIEYMNRKTKGGRTHWDFEHHSDSDHDASRCLTANMSKGVPYNVVLDRRIVKGCSLRTRSYMGQPQQLEIRKDDVSNTVTTVTKDFMVAIFNKKNPIELSELLENVSKTQIKGLKLAVKIDDGYKLVKSEDDLIAEGEYLFIREMTNKEAFRLMGFTDRDYEVARKAVNDKFYKGRDRSKTRLYRMTGNSIVINVCEALFQQLLNVK